MGELGLSRVIQSHGHTFIKLQNGTENILAQISFDTEFNEKPEDRIDGLGLFANVTSETFRKAVNGTEETPTFLG